MDPGAPPERRQPLRSLTVRGPFRGVSGHDRHVREFVRHLAAAGVRLQLVDIPEWSPVKLPPDQRDPCFEGLGDPVGAATVLHFCMPPQVTVAPGRRTVNYTMFEASRVPARWVEHGRRHDLVVVPTLASLEAWTDAGFPRDRVRVCPLGVDAGRFRPGLAPLPLRDREGRPVEDYRVRVLNVSDAGPRKNLLALLRVWVRATTRQDDAVLVLKLGRDQRSGVLRLLRDLAVAEGTWGTTRAEAAPIVLWDAVLPDAAMPRLFAVATHYWSMSHGEGWDQPMMEAGAAGLRLIAPGHSAYTSYLDPSIATLIPARAVPARVEGDPGLARLFEGARWWEPDEDAAAAAIREAVAGRDAPRPGARARIAARFTWEAAARRLLEVLEEP